MPLRVVADATRRISIILDILTEYYCSEVPKHLPFLILTPLVFVLVVSFRVFQSLGTASPTKLLTYEPPNEDVEGPVLHIRQAAIIPPVFYHATDSQMNEYLSPVTDLAAALPKFNESSVEFPMLVSSRSSSTFLPECQQAQCLCLAFLYTDPNDEFLWTDAMTALTRANLPSEESFLFEKSEMSHATLPSWTETPYQIWPGDSLIPRVFALTALVFILAEWTRQWVSHTVRCRTLIIGALFVRFFFALITAISVASMIFSDFGFAIAKHFMLIPVYIAATTFVIGARFLDKIPESSVENYNPLVRLTMACNRMRTSITLSQLIVGFGLCLVALAPPVEISKSLCPIFFIYGFSLMIDFCLHFTIFLPAVYIDLVNEDSHSYSSLDTTQVGFSTDVEPETKSWVPVRVSRFIRDAIFRGLSLDRYLRRRKTLAALVLVANIIMAYSLVFHESDALNSFQPDITRPSDYAEYIDLLVSPKTSIFEDFDFYDIFVPLIIPVKRGFRKPIATTRLLFGSLRYGNTSSIFFEIAALAVFIVSVGMITFMMFVPKHFFDLKFYLPVREKLYINELEAQHELDIMMLETSGSIVSAISWDRKITVADASGLQTDTHTWSKPESALTLPLPPAAWPVKKLLLNPPHCTIALFYDHCIELWNWRVREMVYHFQHEAALKCLPLASFFVGESLIFVTNSGRVVELYAKGAAKVVHVLQNHQIKIATKVSSAKSAHVLLLLIDNDNHVYKARRNVAGEWETEELHIYESMLAVSGSRINTESTLGNGVCSARSAASNPYNVPWTQPSIRDECFSEAVAMPDIEMLLLLSDARVGFFDINTGLFLRYIQIGNYVPGSIRALHSQPVHCAFCGCPAVLSISIAYMDADQPGTLVCHTYQLRDRHRNDICLRVERDPRETRCLGLMSTMEQCHWLENVEVWEASEINTVLGIKRRTGTNEEETSEPQTTGATSFISEVRRRARFYTSLESRRTSQNSRDYEAFALSANGKLTCSEVGLCSNNRDASGQLLEDRISAIGRVGSRSVCIGVGNTLKVLGLGQAQF